MSDDRPCLKEMRRLSASMAAGTDRPTPDEVMRFALRALQEAETIIARQRAELDAVTERQVFHCMGRDLDDVMLACMGEADS